MQLTERRKFKRYINRIPFRMTVLDTFGRVQAFNMQTRDVSREGLGVELSEGQDVLAVTPSLVLEKKGVELEIELPLTGEKIRGMGRIAWYDTGSTEPPYPYLRLGIFLEQMEPGDRKKWEDFVENVARKEGNK